MTSQPDAPLEKFLEAAETVARERADVDPDLAREVLAEAATLLHHGLALDGLDPEDAAAVVDGLCVDLVTEDPGAAIRARAQAAVDAPGGLHDPAAVCAAYLVSAGILQL